MRLTWYGHAAFRIETADCAVIMDPYNHPLAGGYNPIDEPADVVTISHINPKYHSDTSSIHPPFELLNGLTFLDAPVTAAGLTFHACQVFENSEQFGPNAMIRFMAGGIDIAHMGDCGHPLDAGQREFLRGLDVLLALAGGPPTLAVEDLVDVILDIQPPIVFPMHYKTPKINLSIRPVDDLVAAARREGIPVRRIGSSSADLPPEAWPDRSEIWILDHAR